MPRSAEVGLMTREATAMIVFNSSGATQNFVNVMKDKFSPYQLRQVTKRDEISKGPYNAILLGRHNLVMRSNTIVPLFTDKNEYEDWVKNNSKSDENENDESEEITVEPSVNMGGGDENSENNNEQDDAEMEKPSDGESTDNDEKADELTKLKRRVAKSIIRKTASDVKGENKDNDEDDDDTGISNKMKTPISVAQDIAKDKFEREVKSKITTSRKRAAPSSESTINRAANLKKRTVDIDNNLSEQKNFEDLITSIVSELYGRSPTPKPGSSKTKLSPIPKDARGASSSTLLPGGKSTAGGRKKTSLNKLGNSNTPNFF
jgi:hypothetical protein